MPVTRLMPTPEADDLTELVRAIAARELRPHVDQAERDHTFPREVFRTLGRAGILGLPYPVELGGAGQPYEVYLQVLEEIAHVWAAVGVGTERPRAVLLRPGHSWYAAAAGAGSFPSCSVASSWVPTASPRCMPGPTRWR